MKPFLRFAERLQPLGRALMLPIAVLPAAALFLRLGQPDLLNLPFVAAAGGAIFDHLGLIFAIGVGVGLARENHGAAGLAGAIAYLVLTEGAKALMAAPPDAVKGAGATAALVADAYKEQQLAKLSAPAGILCGVVAGVLYNRLSNVKLPEYLAFFGGRRFVLIAAGFAGLAGAALFGLGYPVIGAATDRLSVFVVDAGDPGLFVYGFLNRLMLITGLHHILNNIAWFVVGDYHGVTGDLKRYFAGDPTAGAFMSGFFPVMVFGLPAACLAMYRRARPERRKQLGGMFLSLALTSALTGVTEPIEYSFLFAAPLLYLVHAVLTGLAMVAAHVLGLRLGFGFSAGLIDFVLNLRLSSRPWLLLPLGAAYFAIYYATFSWCIGRFDLLTPGREKTGAAPDPAADGDASAAAFVRALGGADNLLDVAACTTRLRLKVADRTLVDEAALRARGAKAVLPVGDRGLQVVLGPDADRVAGEIQAELRRSDQAQPVRPLPVAADAGPVGRDLAPDLSAEVLAALGGADNVHLYARLGRRRCVTLDNPAKVDEQALEQRAPGCWNRIGPHDLHIVV